MTIATLCLYVWLQSPKRGLLVTCFNNEIVIGQSIEGIRREITVMRGKATKG